MKRPVLHVITDEVLQSRFTHQELAERVAGAGADFVQFREKRPQTTSTLLRVANTLQQICSKTESTRLIVNDRVDVAHAVSCCGVHLGNNDLPIAEARSILGAKYLIGGTLNNPNTLSSDWVQECDYLGVGPVFGTTSKTDPAPALGLEVLAEICKSSSIDVIAIGGIRLDNIDRVLGTGVAGIAVLSDIVCNGDPEKRTKKYMKVLGE